MKAFVHIIESPKPEDLLRGTTEGRALCEAMHLADIPRWYSLVTNKATFLDALSTRLLEAWKHHDSPPILHFSTHGNESEIALTDNTFIDWHELRSILRPITAQMQGGLLICMSSCSGASAARMAMYEDNGPTFWAVVGHPGKTVWSDAAVAYISFYHLFFKGCFNLETCVHTMKVASTDHNFTWFSGVDSKALWVDFMNRQRRQAFGNLQANWQLPQLPPTQN
jgi:hypothetical protein